MPTPNYGLPLYTGTNTAKLDTLLNGQSTAIDTALKAALDSARGSWFSKLPVATAAGSVTLGFTYKTISLPSGRFTQPPLIFLQLSSGASATLTMTATYIDATTTSFSARAVPGHASSATSAAFRWFAIQMTAGNSAG